jgi:rubrerythrin
LPSSHEDTRKKLIELLQMAYSGEKSAAYAFQGHADSVRSLDEKARIREIEADEWHHRDEVGKILAEMNAAPSPMREVFQVMIGRVLQVLCPLGGWYLPMYAAWKLELNNIEEYSKAAHYAEQLALTDVIERLKHMSDVEKSHADYFGTVVQSHPQPQFPGFTLLLSFMDNLIKAGKSPD